MKPFSCPFCKGLTKKDSIGEYKIEFTCKKCGAYYFADTKKKMQQILKDLEKRESRIRKR